LKARMNLSKLLEEEVIVGHGVENARSRENDAVGRAKGGDEDGERDDDLRVTAEDYGDRCSGDGIAGGGASGA